MRKVSAIISAVAFAGLVFAGPVSAEPSDACGAEPVATDQSSYITVCAEGSGSATASSDGYVVADGDSTNEDPLDGYIGVTTDGPVCSDEGDFDPENRGSCSP